MNKTILFAAIGLMISLVLLLSSCSENSKDTIHISGSTTIEPFMKKVVDRFREQRDSEITITATGSLSGITALIAGSCDIVMSSSDLLPTQQRSAEKNGIDIKSFLLGYDLIVPIVNPGNRVSNISLEQLKDIYRGKIQNWSELGGGMP